MPLTNLMHRYTEYNHWANATYASWLASKDPEWLCKEVPSSYSTIATTLAHIRGTEEFWLALMQRSPVQPVFKDGFDGSLPQLLEALTEQSLQFERYVATLSSDQLEEPVVLDQPWMKGQKPRYELIQHCMNHSTYHRGQIVTIARNLGITDPPMTDYNYYNMVIRTEEMPG